MTIDGKLFHAVHWRRAGQRLQQLRQRILVIPQDRRVVMNVRDSGRLNADPMLQAAQW